MNIKHSLSLTALLALAANQAYALDEIKVGGASLTLYGRVAAGIDFTNNQLGAGIQGSRWEAASNQWGVSYWGASGRFALDSETRAVVNLESGFGTDTGAVTTADRLFNRAANVGIEHQRYGTVTVGTHLWIAQDIIDVDPMHFQSIGINTLVNGANDGAAENSILLRSPSYYGVTLGYMHGFGGAAGEFKRSSSDGVSLAYQGGDLTLRAIYGQRADAFGRYSGGDTYGLGSRDAWKYVKNTVVGGAYRIGATRLFAGYQQVKAPESGYGIRANYDEKARMAWLGVNQQLSAQTELLGSFYQLKQSYSGKKSNLFAVGVNHAWNKYLTVYMTAGHIGNNTISEFMVQNTGANSHALSYDDTACDSSLNCNGVKQYGAYAGFVVKF